VPLFILTSISCIVTYITQQASGAVWSIPAILRIPNIFVAYARYIEKMLWPSNLAIYYPYTTHTILLGQTIVSVLVLIVISIRVFQSARIHKYLLVGWLWYLGTLVPVIGLIQVGTQARADRYTYVPLIGLFIMIAWEAADYAKSKKLPQKVIWITALAVLIPLTIYTYKQIGYWQNSTKLYEHTIAVTKGNHFAHLLLARVLKADGETDKAMNHYQQVLNLLPQGSKGHTEARHALAQLLIYKGKMDEAIMHCREILRAEPDDPAAHTELGIALAAKGELDEAISHFRHVLTLEPENAPAHYNLGFAFKLQGKTDEAITHLQESMRIDPNYGWAEKILKKIMQEQNSETPDEEN